MQRALVVTETSLVLAIADLVRGVLSGAWSVSPRHANPAATRRLDVEIERRGQYLTVNDIRTAVVADEAADEDEEGSAAPLLLLCTLSVMCRCAMATAAVHVDQDSLRAWTGLRTALSTLSLKSPPGDGYAGLCAAINAFYAPCDPLEWAVAIGGASVRKMTLPPLGDALKAEVDHLALTALLHLPELMAEVYACRRVVSADPVFECAVSAMAGLLRAVCEAAGYRPREIGGPLSGHQSERVLLQLIGAGCVPLQIMRLAAASPLAAAAVVRAGESLRMAQQVAVHPLPMDMVRRQCRAVDRRHGLLRVPHATYLIQCTRCKIPHSIQATAQDGSRDGLTRVRYDVLTGRFSCSAVKEGSGERPHLYPIQLLGFVVVVSNRAYTICGACGNRAEISVARTGFCSDQCDACHVSECAVKAPRKRTRVVRWASDDESDV
jgi:hypothetical protein